MGVKTVTRTVLVLAVVLCVSSCLVGRYMCNYSLLPAEHGNDLEGDRTKTESRYPGIIAWYDSLHNRGIFRDTTLIGENGYRLHAVFAPACRPAEAEGTAVVVHGYTDNHIRTRFRKQMWLSVYPCTTIAVPSASAGRHAGA